MELQRFFRPRLVPSKGLPFGARSVGHYSVTAPWADDVTKKHFYQLFWGIRGEGILTIWGKDYQLGAGKIALYEPGMIHRIQATSPTWEYRWLTIDGPCAESIFQGFAIGAGCYEGGNVPKEDFENLSRLITNYDKTSEMKASSIAYNILCVAASSIREPFRQDMHQTLILRMTTICNQHWSDSQFNVNAMAQMMGIHRSRLSKIFKESVRVSPQQFISQIRMDHACSLLRETNMSVGEIALKCGFNDQAYFIHVFKNKFGMTPRCYRHINEV